MTKHDAMIEFFKKPILNIAVEQLKFNYSEESANSFEFYTSYSDKVIKNYVRGAEKEYGFSIVIVAPYSKDDDDVNLMAMNFAQKFMDWIQKQNRLKNYPDFGDLCQIKKIENLQNMPNLSGINEKAGLARYMLQARIVYYEKEEN